VEKSLGKIIVVGLGYIEGFVIGVMVVGRTVGETLGIMME